MLRSLMRGSNRSRARRRIEIASSTSPPRHDRGVRSRRQRALRIHVERVDGCAGAHEETILLAATEAEVGTGLREMHLADQVTIRGIAADAVFAGVGPAHRTPHIAIDIRAQAVGHAGGEVVGEDTAVAQAGTIDIEHAYMRGAAVRDARVNYVEKALVGREAQAVRANEIAGYNGCRTVGVEAIDVAWQFRRRLVTFIGAVDA